MADRGGAIDELARYQDMMLKEDERQRVEFAERLANVRDIISYASKGLIPGEKVQVPYLSPSAIREAFGVNEPDAPRIFRYEVVTYTPERCVLGIETNLEENMTTITRLDRSCISYG